MYFSLTSPDTIRTLHPFLFNPQNMEVDVIPWFLFTVFCTEITWPFKKALWPFLTNLKANDLYLGGHLPFLFLYSISCLVGVIINEQLKHHVDAKTVFGKWWRKEINSLQKLITTYDSTNLEKISDARDKSIVLDGDKWQQATVIAIMYVLFVTRNYFIACKGKHLH